MKTGTMGIMVSVIACLSFADPARAMNEATPLDFDIGPSLDLNPAVRNSNMPLGSYGGTLNPQVPQKEAFDPSSWEKKYLEMANRNPNARATDIAASIEDESIRKLASTTPSDDPELIAAGHSSYRSDGFIGQALHGSLASIRGAVGEMQKTLKGFGIDTPGQLNNSASAMINQMAAPSGDTFLQQMSNDPWGTLGWYLGYVVTIIGIIIIPIWAIFRVIKTMTSNPDPGSDENQIIEERKQLLNEMQAPAEQNRVRLEMAQGYTDDSRLQSKGVGLGIEKLSQLVLQGVITSVEFEQSKESFLGAPPDKAATAIELLQNLDMLRKKGVLSEAEFNTKKWEILSERLIPGKMQAETPQPWPPKPPPTTSSAGNQIRIQCPSCQKPLVIADASAGSRHSCSNCQQTIEFE